jgi:UMF1 family MFS transporter
MQTASKKVLNGWAMFDWANSVYNLVITATIFPTYYETIAKTTDQSGQAYVHFAGGSLSIPLCIIIPWDSRS